MFSNSQFVFVYMARLLYGFHLITSRNINGCFPKCGGDLFWGSPQNKDYDTLENYSVIPGVVELSRLILQSGMGSESLGASGS